MIKLFRKNSSEKKSSAEQNKNTLSTEPQQTELQNDDDFLKHFDEFIGVEFYSYNGYSGGSHKRKLVVSEHPEIKEQILSFIECHPIKNLLQGDRDSDGLDLDHWKINFIFENASLNRCICGYGVTECTKLYLRQMIFYIPEELSEEELKIRKEQEMRLRISMQFESEKMNNL